MALSGEDKADVSRAFGKKAAGAVSKATNDGYDGNKRWGNSGIKGSGVNSPAMMAARKGFSDAKNKAIHAKTGGKKGYKSFSEGGRMGARKAAKTDTRDDFMKELDERKGI